MIAILTALSFIIYQDFKFRAVSWVVFPILFMLAVINGVQYVGTAELMRSSLINIGFVVAIFISLTIYFSIKNRSFTNIIDNQIGVADLLLLLVICTVFSPVNFLIYYVSSLFLITLVSAGYIILKQNTKAEIPLAAGFSATLICILVFQMSSVDVNLYDDMLALQVLNKL
ncbi:MAG TPA: hypothetical protein EYN69_11040 [Flavobacteriales bacterium]|nr:hypothetical protein [Flavobacteriales bacterium]